MNQATPASDLLAEVNSIQWFHRIDLGAGICTPGVDRTPDKLSGYHLPSGCFRNKTVLDIGGWDGFYSFHAEREGARRVVNADTWEGIKKWVGPSEKRRGFDLARRVLKSKVEALEMGVYEMSARDPGVFDVVMFFGVLYHLRHPLLAMERVAAVTGEVLFLETHVAFTNILQPCAAFYPKDDLNGDRTNWWGPNLACVTGMLEVVGFKRIQPILPSYADDRLVVHAYK